MKKFHQARELLEDRFLAHPEMGLEDLVLWVLLLSPGRKYWHAYDIFKVLEFSVMIRTRWPKLCQKDIDATLGTLKTQYSFVKPNARGLKGWYFLDVPALYLQWRQLNPSTSPSYIELLENAGMT